MSLAAILSHFTRDTQVEQLVITGYRPSSPLTYFAHTHDPRITVIHKAEGMFILEFGGSQLPMTHGQMFIQVMEGLRRIPNGWITLFGGDKSIYDQVQILPGHHQEIRGIVGLSTTRPPYFG